MKKNTQYLEIKVTNPCQESWDGMRPESTGRHCANCQKIVRDFSQATEAELIDFFRTKPKEVCGRFRPEQLDQPFVFEPLTKNPQLGRWRSAAMIGGLMLGGGMAAGQVVEKPLPPPNTTENQSFVKGDVITEPFVLGEPMAATSPSDKGEICSTSQIEKMPTQADGYVMDEQGEPLIGVHVLFEGTEYGTVTDVEGYFVVPINTPEEISLEIKYLGYKRQLVVLNPKQPEQFENIVVQMQLDAHTLSEVVVKAYTSDLVDVTSVMGLIVALTHDTIPKSISVPRSELFEEDVVDNTLQIFPNPFQNTFNTRFQAPLDGLYRLQLLDLSGRMLEQYTTEFIKGEQQFEAAFQLNALPAGTYLFRLVGPNNQEWMKRVVKVD